jgi:hypothetical protein
VYVERGREFELSQINNKKDKKCKRRKSNDITVGRLVIPCKEMQEKIKLKELTRKLPVVETAARKESSDRKWIYKNG